MGQPCNDVALAIGNQDRSGRRQAALFEVVGKPRQVEAGEYDTGNAAVIVLEALGKMDHPLAGSRIVPIISDGSPSCAIARSKKG